MNFAKKRRDFPPRLHVVHPNNNIVTSPLNSPTSYSSNNNFVKQSNSNLFVHVYKYEMYRVEVI